MKAAFKGIVPSGETLRSIWLYGVLPNLLFYLAGRFIYLMRPVVNVDYLLVGALIPLAHALSPWVAALFLGLVWSNDLAVNVAPVYHFQLADAFHWFSDISYTHWSFVLTAFACALVICAAPTWAILRMSRFSRMNFKTSTALFALCALFSIADIGNGTSFLKLPISVSFADINIAYSGLRKSIMAVRDLAAADSKLNYQPLAVSESAAGQLLAMAKGSQATALPPRIVLVMVESMGLFQDEVLRNSLLTPLQSAAIQARYQVEVRQVPFHGQTINGEFRELCGVRLLGYGEKGFLDCLPKYLRDRGYQTLGLHGFTNQFYNRYRWYPMLGFEKSLFAQDLRGMGLGKKCGASFEGICDTEIAELIHQELLKKPQEQRKFLYWMTLNSHLPLDEQSSVGSAFDCSRNPGTEKNQAICLHSRMVHLVLENIAKIALDPALPPTQFIVVGDHSAPFLANTERSFYSQEVVPAIILEPR